MTKKQTVLKVKETEIQLVSKEERNSLRAQLAYYEESQRNPFPALLYYFISTKRLEYQADHYPGKKIQSTILRVLKNVSRIQ